MTHPRRVTSSGLQGPDAETKTKSTFLTIMRRYAATEAVRAIAAVLAVAAVVTLAALAWLWVFRR